MIRKSALLIFGVPISLFAMAACHSTSSSDAQGSASAAATVSSWPILPADPVDANTPAEDDPATQAYSRIASGMARSAFRACIDRELPKNPKLSGSLVMIVNVDVDGKVASATPTDVEGFNAQSVTCLTKAISGTRFPAPPKGKSIIKMPFKLVSK